jgi:hypothetical protein
VQRQFENAAPTYGSLVDPDSGGYAAAKAVAPISISKKRESTGPGGKETHLSFAGLKMHLDSQENGISFFFVGLKKGN